ncbi:type II toxin-antitoxin system antitoxin HipB [Escherichia coli]|nr:type II toxin-antitoxin system antitoxin HipB [Escherichia coli]
MLWTYDMMSFQKIYSPTQLANAMKLVRQQNGWTQSELAKKIGIKQATISKIDKIYPRHFLATAKVLKFPEVQMHEILSDFARMIPAALDNVKTSLPTDFPENVVTAVETNVLRLHGRLSREYGIK